MNVYTPNLCTKLTRRWLRANGFTGSVEALGKLTKLRQLYVGAGVNENHECVYVKLYAYICNICLYIIYYIYICLFLLF